MMEADVNTRAHEVLVREDVRIRMRDGVHLAQDVYLPALRGRPLAGGLPVLLERTPYDRRGVRDSEHTAADRRPWTRVELAQFFARHGYAVVLQDCRGRYGSEGVFTKYVHEAEDGYDTMEWIAAQPWYGGAIGTFGLSYSAHTQTSLAALRPPGLKAMVLDCGGMANAYRNGVRHGGAFELKQVTWAYRHARQHLLSTGDSAGLAAIDAEDLAGWMTRWPWKRGNSPIRWAPEYESYLFDQWEHGLFDEYWRQPALYAAGHYPAFEGIAVLLLSGWYDPYAQTTTDNFLGLSQRREGALEMILGTWLHGQRSSSVAGEVDFGPDATLDGRIAPDYFALRLAWFDHWLKGEPRREPACVRYFRMGGGSGRRNAAGHLEHGGCWLEAEQWPPAGIEEQQLYLHADGRIAAAAPRETGGVRSFVHDPGNPVPTIGGAITSGLPVMTGGAFDQRERPEFFGAHPPWRPLADRPDVLTFQTEPLTEDLEVTGTVWFRLKVSTDAPDADFVVKLIDVHPPGEDYPEGFAMNLTDSIFRCRYREGWDREVMMEPGRIAEIAIEAPPVSNLFRTGHRLRIDIAGSNFPRFDVNPATGEPVGRAEHSRPAVQSVHCDAEHTSCVILPVRRVSDGE
jgi:uncharacterized protein